MARGYARARERDEAARAALVPLAPGERPRAVTAAAALAALIALGLVLRLVLGTDEGDPPTTGFVLLAVVMAVAAIGMWRTRYWAVLGFQVFLGVTLVYAVLGLMLAGNLAAVVQSAVVVAIAGPLFWFLIRAMARIQMPKRPNR